MGDGEEEKKSIRIIIIIRTHTAHNGNRVIFLFKTLCEHMGERKNQWASDLSKQKRQMINKHEEIRPTKSIVR